MLLSFGFCYSRAAHCPPGQQEGLTKSSFHAQLSDERTGTKGRAHLHQPLLNLLRVEDVGKHEPSKIKHQQEVRSVGQCRERHLGAKLKRGAEVLVDIEGDKESEERLRLC